MKAVYRQSQGLILFFEPNEAEDGIKVVNAVIRYYEQTGRSPDALYRTLLEMGGAAEIHNAIYGTTRRRKV